MGFGIGKVFSKLAKGASKISPYKQLLEQAENTGDSIIGAIDGKKVTKMFLMEGDKVYGHRTFLEGTERGFAYVFDNAEQGWKVIGSGTPSPIGKEFLGPGQRKIIERLFGL